MKLGKGAKLALGLATAWPLVYMVLFIGTILYHVFAGGFSNAPPSSGGGPPGWFMVLFLGHFVTMVLIFALLVIYLMHVFKSDRVPQDKKALWAAVLFLGNMLAMPVYFYLHVWREPAPPKAP